MKHRPLSVRYIGEDIQKTGIAMETSKFTVLCHGKKRETLTANAVVALFPKLQPLKNIQGTMEHLSGEVSCSRNNQFHLVNLIDSPGLVDGERSASESPSLETPLQIEAMSL
ncbi:hypothetical protein BIW11_12390 [Tropilaelaps mercedesae]|uniref:G domain-containing protein n=1 Tax=Tropilaelaps mercedesae TaxID=418985 RepID=A0A1V9X745_9ACAR|nr:hypothetical protein BIW11_12390 [Tropilaelaps mercedesae]